MTNRPPEPEFLIQWRELMRAGPPKCCFTCDYYTKEGVCDVYDSRPPDGFASSVDACEHWIIEIPF